MDQLSPRQRAAVMRLLDRHESEVDLQAIRDLLRERFCESMPTRPRPAIAFDYGGTLRVSDGAGALRNLVAVLNLLDVPTVIVSAVMLPIGEHESKVRAEIEKLTSSDGRPLRFDTISFVYYPRDPSVDEMVACGRDKARKATEAGAVILFDDSEWIAKGCAQCGFPVVRACRWN